MATTLLSNNKKIKITVRGIENLITPENNVQKLSKESLQSMSLSLLNRLLGSTDKNARDEAVQSISDWLVLHKHLKEEEFDLLWKALYYCVWLSDKPLVQQQLVKYISLVTLDLVEHDELWYKYYVSFWRKINKEWKTIDKYRLNKYYLLIREFLKIGFKISKLNNCNIIKITQYLSSEIMEMSKCQLGIIIFVIENYLDVLLEVYIDTEDASSSSAFYLFFTPIFRILLIHGNKNKELQLKIATLLHNFIELLKTFKNNHQLLSLKNLIMSILTSKNLDKILCDINIKKLLIIMLKDYFDTNDLDCFNSDIDNTYSQIALNNVLPPCSAEDLDNTTSNENIKSVNKAKVTNGEPKKNPPKSNKQWAITRSAGRFIITHPNKQETIIESNKKVLNSPDKLKKKITWALNKNEIKRFQKFDPVALVDSSSKCLVSTPTKSLLKK